VTDVAVDPVELRAVGATVRSIGSRIAAAVPPGAVQAAGDGWAASAAMSKAGGQWLAEIRALSSALAAVGFELGQAADRYEQADERSAGSMRGHARWAE
jgi:uncharacterized protein YukE